MVETDYTSYNLKFFLEENKDFLLAGCKAFQGITRLLDTQMMLGRISVGYGDGFDFHGMLEIPDRNAFEQEQDDDTLENIVEHVAFVTAVSPLATLAMRRQLFARLGVNNKSELERYYATTSNSSKGKQALTSINLGLVWAATCRNKFFETNSPEVTYLDFLVIAQTRHDLHDHTELQVAIKEILRCCGDVWFRSLSVSEARTNFEKMSQKAKEFDIYNYVRRNR